MRKAMPEILTGWGSALALLVLDRAVGNPGQDVGDLRLGELEVVAQHEDLALPVRELSEGVEHGAAAAGPFQAALAGAGSLTVALAEARPVRLLPPPTAEADRLRLRVQQVPLPTPTEAVVLARTGDGRAILSWGQVAAAGRWAMALKDRIDRRFMRRLRR